MPISRISFFLLLWMIVQIPLIHSQINQPEVIKGELAQSVHDTLKELADQGFRAL
ncbi:MAG: hypothetical protein OER04_00060 [Cyclobacteriaceae bacterium]|nr:hypothetical protein [Cyclobacteriaceae bacterium]